MSGRTRTSLLLLLLVVMSATPPGQSVFLSPLFAFGTSGDLISINYHSSRHNGGLLARNAAKQIVGMSVEIGKRKFNLGDMLGSTARGYQTNSVWEQLTKSTRNGDFPNSPPEGDLPLTLDLNQLWKALYRPPSQWRIKDHP
ncbi:hypothetical protein Hamer_G014801 [Homarus americanus]|uniref:Uncharacterized protein n=1 Tax=Homarus americanus TaxID=6706 RepID=A0A8J5N1W2_HOMAM|nr:hypothetical protein Hamer_G014801 [Homarus americanus]